MFIHVYHNCSFLEVSHAIGDERHRVEAHVVEAFGYLPAQLGTGLVDVCY